MRTNNQDFQFLNIKICKYDMDCIQSDANNSLREGRGYSAGMAWAEALMNYLFKHNLLNRDIVKTYNEVRAEEEKKDVGGSK